MKKHQQDVQDLAGTLSNDYCTQINRFNWQTLLHSDFPSLRVHYYNINFFNRKTKIDTGKKSKTMTVDSEDDNSEKENVSSNDNDDVFK